MASQSRRAKTVLIGLVVVVCAGGVFAWKPVLRLVSTQRIWTLTRDAWFHEDARAHETVKGRVREYQEYHRWRRIAHGWQRGWFEHNGFLAYETEWRNGRPIRGTEWRRDGSIREQWDDVDRGGRAMSKRTPPWWWGVTEQSQPTAPWWGKE